MVDVQAEKGDEKRPFRVWGHPQVFERSSTSQANGWTMIEEFENLENAEKHVKRLADDLNNWKKFKSYRVEETVLAVTQVNVGRDPYMKPYVNPLKGFRDV